MSAAGKGEVTVRVSADIESLGRIELRRITVRRAYAQRQAGLRWHHHAANADCRRRDAITQLIRALEPQHFFNGCLDEFRRCQQTRSLCRILAQTDQAIADQVGRGLVTGVEQEDTFVKPLCWKVSPRPLLPGSAS